MERLTLDGTNDHSSQLLTSLPWHDVLYKHVFRCLDIPSLLSLGKACTEFEELTQGYFSLMTYIDLGKHASSISPTDLRRLFETNNSKLRRLMLKNCKSNMDDGILLNTLINNKCLQIIDLTNCTALTNNTLQVIAVNCPDLRTLSLRDCPWVSAPAVTNIALCCRRIRQLDLSGCWHIDDATVGMICKSCTQLTEINLARIYGLTDRSVKSIAMNSLSITDVNIRDCWRVTDESIWLLGEYSTKLKVLQVKGCRSVTPRSLTALKNKGVILDCHVKTLASFVEPRVQI